MSQTAPQTIRVMHINNRIRVRIFAGETLDELLQKVSNVMWLANQDIL